MKFELLLLKQRNRLHLQINFNDMNENTKGILYASLTSLLWGFLAIGQKVMLDYADPYTIVCSRFFIAFIILLVYFIIQKPQELKILKRPPFLIIIAGIAVGINYVGSLKGLDYTTPGNLQILIQTSPLMLLLVSILLFKEKVTKTQIFGFFLVVIGLAVFYRNQLIAFANNEEAYNIGIIYIFIAAVAWVFYAIIQKILVKKYHAQLLNMIMYFIPMAALLPFVDYSTFARLELWQLILLICLGLNTLIAYGSISLAFKYTQANKVSIIITFAPVITVITMTILTLLNVTWIKGEILSLESSIGAAFIILGIMSTKFNFNTKNLLRLVMNRKNRG